MKKEISQEVLDYFGKFDWFDKSYIIVDQSDNLLIYNGSMYLKCLDFVEVPISFLHFKEIIGFLSFDWCKNLRSLENLRNVRYVGFMLDLSNTSIENLKGLGNLDYVGSYLTFFDCPNFKSFDGLNPDVVISDIHNNGSGILPRTINQEFLEWRKNKQIQKISRKFLEK